MPGIKIHKIAKDDLSVEGTVNVLDAGLLSTSSMIISHYASSDKEASVSIHFTIEGVEKQITHLRTVEFSTVIREKVNLTATSVNGNKITGIGSDVGEYEYVENVPSRPLDLPPGFTEIYRK